MKTKPKKGKGGIQNEFTHTKPLEMIKITPIVGIVMHQSPNKYKNMQKKRKKLTYCGKKSRKTVAWAEKGAKKHYCSKTHAITASHTDLTEQYMSNNTRRLFFESPIRNLPETHLVNERVGYGMLTRHP